MSLFGGRGDLFFPLAFFSCQALPGDRVVLDLSNRGLGLNGAFFGGLLALPSALMQSHYRAWVSVSPLVHGRPVE